MAGQWHYQLFGEEFGPVSEEVIQNLVAMGTLTADDTVRRSGGSWVPVTQALNGAGDNRNSTSTATAVVAEQADDSDDVEDWYCQVLGQELGPLTFNDLLRFAETGELSADDQVRFGVEGKWRRVGSLGRLVAILPYQAAPSTRLKPKLGAKPERPVANVIPEAAAPVPPPPAVVTPSEIPEAIELKWYAWIRGVEYGPSSLVQLQQWLTSGQLGAADFVKLGPTGTWFPSASVTEILTQLTAVANAAKRPVAPTPVVAAAPAPVPVPAAVPATAVKSSQPVVAAVSKPAPAKPATLPEASAAVVKAEPVAPVRPPEPKPAPPISSSAAYSGSNASTWASSPPKTAPKPIPKPRSSSSGSSIDLSFLTGLADTKTLGIGGGVIAAIALVIAFMYMPAGNGPETKAFKELHALYVEFQQVREKKGTAADVQAISSKAEKLCPPIVAALEPRASVSRPATQKLFWVAKYRVKEMLAKGPTTRSPAEIECERMLFEVSKVLQLPMNEPKPVETVAAKGPVRPSLD